MKRQQLEARFKAWYNKYFEDTVIYISRLRFSGGIRFSREEARELAQDAFIRVLQGMEEFRGETAGEERAYIKKVALRIALNKARSYRAEKRRAEEISIEDLPAPESTPSRDLFTGLPPSTGEDYTGRRETIQRLLDAIVELPENLQEPLRLRIQGNKYSEIGAWLNLSVDSVKSNLRDARRCLRAKLGEEPTGIAWPAEVPEDSHDREI